MKFRTFRIVATLGLIGTVVTGATLLFKKTAPAPQAQPATTTAGATETPPVADKTPEKAATPDPAQAAPKAEDKRGASSLPEPPTGSKTGKADATDTPKDDKAPKAPKSSDQKSAGEALRPLDEAVLKLLKKPISGDKVKDALPKEAVKVNLFGAGGKVARLKLDLNRNDKWDEKWEVVSEGGAEIIHRQVAPADDENYTKKYRLDGASWVPEKSEK